MTSCESNKLSTTLCTLDAVFSYVLGTLSPRSTHPSFSIFNLVFFYHTHDCRMFAHFHLLVSPHYHLTLPCAVNLRIQWKRFLLRTTLDKYWSWGYLHHVYCMLGFSQAIMPYHVHWIHKQGGIGIQHWALHSHVVLSRGRGVGPKNISGLYIILLFELSTH